jgi:hypothetical protein
MFPPDFITTELIIPVFLENTSSTAFPKVSGAKNGAAGQF